MTSADEYVHIPQLLADVFTISTSEARRCISLGGVRVDGELVTELDMPVEAVFGKEIRLGKWREVVVGGEE